MKSLTCRYAYGSANGSVAVNFNYTDANGNAITATTNLKDVADKLPIYLTLSIDGGNSGSSWGGSGIGGGNSGSATGDIYYTISTDGTEPAWPTVDNATKYVTGTKIPINKGTCIKYVIYFSSQQLYGQYYKCEYTLKCDAPRFTPNMSGDFNAVLPGGSNAVLWETGHAALDNKKSKEKVYYNIVFFSENEEFAKAFKEVNREKMDELLPDPTPENGTLMDLGYFIDGEYCIKARAFRDGWDPSDIYWNHHTLKLNEGTISPEAGRYDEPQKITLTGGWEGNGGQHYYITIDGSDPATSDTRIMLNSGRSDEKDVPDFYLDHSATVKWTHATAHYHTDVKEATYQIKAGADLSFAQESYEAIIDEDFESPVLTNPNNLEVTWASANEKVATVDQQGRVTIVGEGETTISASFAGNDDYRKGEASYILYVREQAAVLEIVGEKSTVRVTEKDEVKDLFGDGTAVYTKENATLTLNNYTGGGLLRGIGQLNIRLKGKNSLDGIDFGYGNGQGSLARADAPRRAEGQGDGLLTIAGDGIEESSLAVVGSNKANMHGSDINLYLADLIVKDCDLHVSDCSTAISTKGTDYLKFDNVHALLTGGPAIENVMDRIELVGVEILQPQGGYFSEKMHSIVTSLGPDDEEPATTVEIGPKQEQQLIDTALQFTREQVTAYYGQTPLPPSLLNKWRVEPLEWTSTDTKVASVADDNGYGKLTLSGIGQTTISASFKGDDQFLPSTASYTLDVHKGWPSITFEPMTQGVHVLLNKPDKVT